MVEPLDELNKIVQKPRYREVGNFMVRKFLRDAALPVTWLLLHTGITANQVTFISLIVAIAGCVSLALRADGFFLIGCILLQLWYYLDHVDGQIARYRKTDCLSGRFFDFMTHHIVHGLVFFPLGVYVWNHSEDHIFYIFGGFITSFSIMLFNLMHDTKYKTYFEKIMQKESLRVRKPDAGPVPAAQNVSVFRKIISFLHKSCEIHVVMNILTVTALLETLLSFTWNFRWIAFWFYLLVIPFLTITKIYYWISTRKIDADFERDLETR